MTIETVADVCVRAIWGGHKIMFCGNGGSMAHAMHLASELTVRFRASVHRPSWGALALCANPVELSAVANDFGFDECFAHVLIGLGRPGDVLFGITTSGRSKNVTR